MDEFFEYGGIKIKKFPINKATQHLIPKKRFFIIENPYIEEILWAIDEQRNGRDAYNILLVGEPGCGKSTLIEYLAAELNMPLIQIQGDGEVSPSDLIGSISYNTNRGGTFWQDGKIPFGIRNKCSLLFDEINCILPEVLMRLHSAMDDRRALDLKEHILETEIEGTKAEMPETLSLPPETIIFGTQNPSGSGRHIGVKSLSPALDSRFNIRINIDYLSPDNEIKLLQHRTGIDKDIAKKMVDLANESRKAFRNQEMSMPLDHRMLIMWAALTTKFGIQRAIQTTILSRLNESDQDSLRGLLIAMGLTTAKGREK